MASTKRNTALAFLKTFDDLDLEANLSFRIPTCRHTIAPASVNFQADMNNNQFAAHLMSLKERIAGIPVTVKEVFEDKGGDHVTVWATSNARWREEAMDDDPEVDWTYNGEYIFLLTMNPAGDKIERILEFVDSTKVEKVRMLSQRADRNLAAKK